MGVTVLVTAHCRIHDTNTAHWPVTRAIPTTIRATPPAI